MRFGGTGWAGGSLEASFAGLPPFASPLPGASAPPRRPGAENHVLPDRRRSPQAVRCSPPPSLVHWGGRGPDPQAPKRFLGVRGRRAPQPARTGAAQPRCVRLSAVRSLNTAIGGRSRCNQASRVACRHCACGARDTRPDCLALAGSRGTACDAPPKRHLRTPCCEKDPRLRKFADGAVVELRLRCVCRVQEERVIPAREKCRNGARRRATAFFAAQATSAVSHSVRSFRRRSSENCA